VLFAGKLLVKKERNVSKVAIVTDSVACIPEKLLQSLDIHTVAYYIHRGQETLRDLVTLKRDEFYTWLPTATELPKTANPGPNDYLELYEKLALEGIRKIISIHITSKGSGAYQAAMMAKEEFSNRLSDLQIEVIDTLNVSMCQGWMAIEAARSALEGKSFEDIITQIKQIIPGARMIQMADTLKYLYMGGRIGKATSLLGSMLSIKPIVGMEDGIIVPLGKARSRSKAYRVMVDLLEEKVGQMGKIKIAYVHAAALEEVENLKAVVDERFQVVEELVTELTPALGVHTGVGTVGFCYYPILNP
jgi:DegV family protein with EDD domain